MSAHDPHVLRAIDWEWLVERRRKLLDVGDVALARHRSFFCALEMATSSLLTPFVPALSDGLRARRNAIVQNTVAHLVMRLRRRLTLDRPLSDPRIAKRQSLIEESIGELSRLQIANLHAHFAMPNGALALTEVRDSFEKFANGELRLGPDGSTPGNGRADPYMTMDAEPSGDFFFLFAEFAIVAIESEIERAVWELLLPILVSTQEIMTRAYAPPVGQRKLGQYSSIHFERNFEARMNASEIEALRTRYLELDAEALDRQATANARAAYCDGP